MVGAELGRFLRGRNWAFWCMEAWRTIVLAQTHMAPDQLQKEQPFARCAQVTGCDLYYSDSVTKSGTDRRISRVTQDKGVR